MLCLIDYKTTSKDHKETGVAGGGTEGGAFASGSGLCLAPAQSPAS